VSTPSGPIRVHVAEQDLAALTMMALALLAGAWVRLGSVERDAR
jgi:hypothetical protein